MANLSSATENLVARVKAFSAQDTETGAKIHVDYIAARVAAFYEKIRTVVDYQEEHLFRKNNIDRVLKRRLFFTEDNTEDIAGPLISEIIRAGYLPNDTIPENEIQQVQRIINKYVYLLRYIKDLELESSKADDLIKWLVSLASVEIEERLAPPDRDQAIANYMFTTIEPRIVLSNITLHEEERKAQVFIGIQKALLRADVALLNYRLLKYHFPQWTESSKAFFDAIAPRLLPLKNALAAEITHPLGNKFFQICNQYNTPFLILGDALIKEPELLDKSPEEIENAIDEAYQQRYNRLRGKLKRAAIYSTLSIFVTKVVFALGVEVPFDKWVTNDLSWLALGINIVFPPILMFLIVFSIRPPRSENAQKVIVETMKIIYHAEKQDTYEVKPTLKRSVVLRTVIDLFYLIISLLVFGLIIWGLLAIKFSLLSIAIFIVFVSLICFAGLKIRQRLRELSIEKPKDSGLSFLIDLFALPLVQTGKWLSGQWSRLNFFVILFNIVLEVPVQIFVEFLENWRFFLKEKKEEIQ